MMMRCASRLCCLPATSGFAAGELAQPADISLAEACAMQRIACKEFGAILFEMGLRHVWRD
eukprot:990060-Amphidinium_carterae.1